MWYQNLDIFLISLSHSQQELSLSNILIKNPSNDELVVFKLERFLELFTAFTTFTFSFLQFNQKCFLWSTCMWH